MAGSNLESAAVVPQGDGGVLPPPAGVGERVTWRHRGLALLSGVLYPLSHPTVWPGDMSLETLPHALTQWLAFVCLVPLLWAVRHLSPWRAYVVSAWTFIPGISIIFYWLVIAMNVFGGIPVAVAVALLLLLATVGWQYMACAVGVARAAEERWGVPVAVTVPVGWVGMEYCRGHFYFGGLPWASLGTSQSDNLPILQLGALGGVYLVIALVAFVNAVVFEGLRGWAGERRVPVRLLGAGVAALAGSALFGLLHIRHVDALAAEAPKVRVGMLQGNVEQGIKNKDWLHADAIIQKYARLQKEAIDRGAQVVIWPEAAFPLPFDREEKNVRHRRFPPLFPAVGVVGAVAMWREPPVLKGEVCRQKPQPPGCQPAAHLHNSAVVLDQDLNVRGRFDKAHLVPFGEYVPWPLGRVARAIVPAMGRTVPGDNWTPVELPVAGERPKVGSLICYEGVFPQYARRFAAGGADLLINVTNDAWYGVSSAAPQHLSFYAVRAAETGRAVARVANTGITAGIDPAGRILQPTGLYDEAAVVMELPLMRHRTVYTVVGDVVGWGCAAPFLLALGHELRRWYQGRRRARAGRKAAAAA
jgi:apolipoprotein N-acyltransferase